MNHKQNGEFSRVEKKKKKKGSVTFPCRVCIRKHGTRRSRSKAKRNSPTERRSSLRIYFFISVANALFCDAWVSTKTRGLGCNKYFFYRRKLDCDAVCAILKSLNHVDRFRDVSERTRLRMEVPGKAPFTWVNIRARYIARRVLLQTAFRSCPLISTSRPGRANFQIGSIGVRVRGLNSLSGCWKGLITC